MIEFYIKKDFLESKIEEDIYIRTPDILNTLNSTYQDKKFRKLNQYVYVLFKSSKNFYEEITNYLTTKIFNMYEGETCILNKQDIYIGLYVDDLLIIGPTNQVHQLIKEIKVRFELHVENNIKELLGCELIIQDKKIILHQLKIILKLLQDFHQEIKNLKFKGFPMGNLIKVTSPLDDSSDILPTNKQVRYHSGVGSLLYLVKNSRPDLKNSVRELSKIMDRSEQEGYKKLLKVLNFLKNNTNLGIIFNP